MTHDATSTSQLGSAEIEIRTIALDYAHLRVADAGAEARLCASLERQGQLHPLSIAARDGGESVLVDGYRRVRAFRRLGVDVARVIVVGSGEAEALAFVHRLASGGRRSALEEGWLVRELCAAGWSLDRVGDSLGRGRSWVSRRLGLADGLPPAIADLVRRGTISAHAAMRSLLPLARANATDAERIATALSSSRPSSRQLGALWSAYKCGDAEQRARIVEHPALFLRVHASSAPAPSESTVLAALRRAERALGDAHAGVVASNAVDATTADSRRVRHAITRVARACEAISSICPPITEGGIHAD